MRYKKNRTEGVMKGGGLKKGGSDLGEHFSHLVRGTEITAWERFLIAWKGGKGRFAKMIPLTKTAGEDRSTEIITKERAKLGGGGGGH